MRMDSDRAKDIAVSAAAVFMAAVAAAGLILVVLAEINAI